MSEEKKSYGLSEMGDFLRLFRRLQSLETEFKNVRSWGSKESETIVENYHELLRVCGNVAFQQYGLGVHRLEETKEVEK